MNDVLSVTASKALCFPTQTWGLGHIWIFWSLMFLFGPNIVHIVWMSSKGRKKKSRPQKFRRVLLAEAEALKKSLFNESLYHSCGFWLSLKQLNLNPPGGKEHTAFDLQGNTCCVDGLECRSWGLLDRMGVDEARLSWAVWTWPGWSSWCWGWWGGAAIGAEVKVDRLQIDFRQLAALLDVCSVWLTGPVLTLRDWWVGKSV